MARGQLSFRRRHPNLIRALLFAATFFISFGAGLAYGAWALVCRGGKCPPVEALEEYTPRQTSKLYAVDGRFIAELGAERRTLVKLDEIPEHVQQAFVVTEDKRFYSHAGIDWRRVIGASIHDLLARSWDEGFSTITMQLARNVFPETITREKTPVRKIREGKVARAIEAKYSKRKILELYLNQIPLGNGAFGVETASQRYFGKSVRNLNVAEAATLAALPKAPERYNPRKHPDRAIQRRNTVIDLMRRNHLISDSDARGAQAFPLQLANKAESGDIAPYFVEWIRQQLDEQFGKQVYEQGLKVYTTLDLDMQSAAERSLERQLRRIEFGQFGRFRHETYEHYIARSLAGTEVGENSPYLQGALLALDPRNGAVRAMVGGRDFYDSKFNRATQALRQPGSAFKPIVYAAAIQSGRPPSYIVDDSPIEIPQMAGKVWAPKNYDGRFEGPMPMRRGLYESRNLVAIKVGMELGEQTVINEARNFTQVLSPEEPWLMVDMMKDVIRRGTAAGAVWGAGFHIPAGGKTGTTNDGTNVWFIGYTADLVAGVWMGFDRPQKIMGDAQGGRLAAPAWTQFMSEVYRRKPAPPDWPRPLSIITREIDVSTGMLQTPYCPRDLIATEFYIPGTEPTQECDKHYPGFLGAGVPDSTGAYPPPPAYQPTPVPPPSTGRVIPGAAPVPRPGRATDTLGLGTPPHAGRSPTDTSRIFTVPRTPRSPTDTGRRSGNDSLTKQRIQ